MGRKLYEVAMSERVESVERLRRQAERALEQSRSPREIERALERLVAAAADRSEDALFAHRHLAELRLEDNPWRAALHLRRVLVVREDDDVVHALMGLCQALLGNYRAAVSAYRRALRTAPHTPWYHHNLGHLLDVALDRPTEAEGHLRTANRMEPDHDEITASLAHCLGRLQKLAEAKVLAEDAVRQAPRNKDHRALLEWIDEGAPHGRPAAGDAKRGSKQRRSKPRQVEGAREGRMAVRKAFERGMREAGFSARELERARALWSDFHEGRQVRVIKPEVYAAAVEYAIALIHRRSGATQAAIARRYGVAATSVSTRYGEIRDALRLRPGDPRYAASP